MRKHGSSDLPWLVAEFYDAIRRVAHAHKFACKIHQTTEVASWLERGLLAAYLVSVVAFCGLIAINGHQIRAAAEAQEALVAEEENRAFCGTLGIGPEATLYTQCAAGLADIRARALQRSASNSIL
jgi:hypothetical protein